MCIEFEQNLRELLLAMHIQSKKITLDQDLLKNQISPIKFHPRAHTQSIQSLAVHPAYKIFATGSHDKTIKLWDVASFKETMTLSDHKQGVWALNYNKDGSLLASGGPDRTVLIWDSKKNSAGIKITAHKDKIYATKFNETGKLLATCGQQGELFVWDIAKTNQPLFKLQLPSLVIYDVTWSGTEDLLFASTLSSQLFAFDSKTFKQIASDYVTQNDKHSKCETIAANYNLIKNRIFCGSSRGVIAWYEIENGKLQKQTEWLSHLDSVRTINYHPSRKVFLSTGRDGSAKLWDASSNTHQPSILGNLALHVQNIPGAGFIGEDMVVTGSWDQKLGLWSLKELLK